MLKTKSGIIERILIVKFDEGFGKSSLISFLHGYVLTSKEKD
ncbi:hypothetical protein [Bacillus sp. MRMR6]|nr:hypothetical protein [Bacillus sp. MRMR6]